MSEDPAGDLWAGDSPARKKLLLLVCLTAMVCSGCGHSADALRSISIQQQITPQPVHVGGAAISVQLSGHNAAPVSGATIMIETEMNHPGMKPYFKTATEFATGHFQAPLSFDMPGDWVVLLHVTLANGKQIERQIDVRGVQPH